MGVGGKRKVLFSFKKQKKKEFVTDVIEICWGCDIVFFWFMLPEMKNRSLEELDELFQNRVSVRDFKKYQCISSERARELAHTDVIGDSKRAGSAAVETVEDTDTADKV